MKVLGLLSTLITYFLGVRGPVVGVFLQEDSKLLKIMGNAGFFQAFPIPVFPASENRPERLPNIVAHPG